LRLGRPRQAHTQEPGEEAGREGVAGPRGVDGQAVRTDSRHGPERPPRRHEAAVRSQFDRDHREPSSQFGRRFRRVVAARQFASLVPVGKEDRGPGHVGQETLRSILPEEAVGRRVGAEGNAQMPAGRHGPLGHLARAGLEERVAGEVQPGAGGESLRPDKVRRGREVGPAVGDHRPGRAMDVHDDDAGGGGGGEEEVARRPVHGHALRRQVRSQLAPDEVIAGLAEEGHLQAAARGPDGHVGGRTTGGRGDAGAGIAVRRGVLPVQDDDVEDHVAEDTEPETPLAAAGPAAGHLAGRVQETTFLP